MDEFSSAFVRFDNGASLIIEVSWLLHHGSDNDDVQTWLYGTKAGAHWPKCEIYETNNALKQHYDRTLKITDEKLRPHHQEIVDFAQAIVDGAPSPEGSGIRENLAKQITSSVQWIKTVENIAAEGVTTFLEIGPGTVLKGLIRKIDPDLVVYNIQKPEDIDIIDF